MIAAHLIVESEWLKIASSARDVQGSGGYLSLQDTEKVFFWFSPPLAIPSAPGSRCCALAAPASTQSVRLGFLRLIEPPLAPRPSGRAGGLPSPSAWPGQGWPLARTWARLSSSVSGPTLSTEVLFLNDL